MKVLFISFSGGFMAERWLERLDRPYPLLVDRERVVYRAYGLERSIRRSWSPRTLHYYLRQWWSGNSLPSSEGDLHQLGGDFVIEKGGIVRLAYYSRDPVDRPPVETLLAAIPDAAPKDRP